MDTSMDGYAGEARIPHVSSRSCASFSSWILGIFWDTPRASNLRLALRRARGDDAMGRVSGALVGRRSEANSPAINSSATAYFSVLQFADDMNAKSIRSIISRQEGCARLKRFTSNNAAR